MNNSVTLSTFTTVCNHHFYLLLNISINPKGKPTHIQQAVALHFSFPPVPGKQPSAFCLSWFTYSGYFIWMESYAWYVTLYVWLLSTSTVFHPCCSMYLIPFHGWIIFHHVCTTCCLPAYQLMDIWVVAILWLLWCCCEHVYIYICLSTYFQFFFGYTPRSRITGTTITYGACVWAWEHTCSVVFNSL